MWCGEPVVLDILACPLYLYPMRGLGFLIPNRERKSIGGDRVWCSELVALDILPYPDPILTIPLPYPHPFRGLGLGFWRG